MGQITYGEVVDAVLKLVDEFSRKGVELIPSKTADLRLKLPEATNNTLMNLATTTCKLASVKEIVQNPVQNTLYEDTSEIKQHLPGIDFSIIQTNAKAYFFETTGLAKVTIDESSDNGSTWVNMGIDPVISGDNSEFAEYKGLITPSAETNLIRLTFTGDYIYNFRNYILYKYPFPNKESIQQHRPYFLYDFPTDFWKLNNIMVRKTVRKWEPFTQYIVDKANEKIGIIGQQAGEFQINYWRYPAKVDTVNPDDLQVLDVVPEAADILALGVASYAYQLENPAFSTDCWNRFEIGKQNLDSNTSNSIMSNNALIGW